MEKTEIIIDGLRVRANHGVMPQETLVGNIFEVSLRVSYPPSRIGMDDDMIVHTLNYAKVVELIQSVMATPSHLLEHVAKRIYTSLKLEFPGIDGGEITIRKLTPPISAEVDAVGFCYRW